jgi:hypothetical protein
MRQVATQIIERRVRICAVRKTLPGGNVAYTRHGIKRAGERLFIPERERSGGHRPPLQVQPQELLGGEEAGGEDHKHYAGPSELVESVELRPVLPSEPRE